MAQRTLTLLEVTGIQPYIFGSNQLAQNIGASELVTLSTTKWVVKQLDELVGQQSHNARWDGVQVEYDGRSLADGLRAEVVYAGGGNAMLLFTEKGDASDFVNALTTYLLQNARGLQLVVAHETFDWDKEALTAASDRGHQMLARRKRDRPVSAPLLGLGVTATCVYTGLPAIGYDDDPQVVGDKAAQKAREIDSHQLISGEVADKLRAEDWGRERLHAVLPAVRSHYEYDFVYDFEHFGTKGESSYIAVIHADGNRMGERFKALKQKYGKREQNGEYVRALRTLSQAVRQRAREALQTTTDYLINSLDAQGNFGGKVPTPNPRRFRHRRLLPFRPIVFGGDDVTFVSDGRLGLDLAARYLQAFTGGDLAGEPVHARAGVAIVKTHYPFSRAYDLADQLAAQARQAITDFAGSQGSATVLDWHFATTGMLYEVEDIRKREYADGSLLMRPVWVGGSDRTWRTWHTFATLVQEFQDENGQWVGRRNKVKALRDALREGDKAVRLFLTNYRLDHLPLIQNRQDVALSGWHHDGRCAYFDAIEAMDFFVSLAKPAKAGVP